MKGKITMIADKKRRTSDRKTAPHRCPFTGRRCTKCSLYRGRHCHLFFPEDSPNSLKKDRVLGNPRIALPSTSYA
jgi:hypothetical protein